ncbi:hypothetical protein Lalb_Chr15g0078061 [Lupinus albus]|uniref:Uncharacterized protein n=1 Tax=Lupinus albus TaxID=3870 RepID=A0A6A4NX90_LUPAL|nr:hypothetical protein Lalb_Chr15g0078061 [Lupinus albus]
MNVGLFRLYGFVLATDFIGKKTVFQRRWLCAYHMFMVLSRAYVLEEEDKTFFLN